MKNSKAYSNKKVLLLCDFFSSLGGTEYYNFNLARQLHRHGTEVKILIGEKPKFNHWIKLLEQEGISYITPKKIHSDLNSNDIEVELIDNVVNEINLWRPDIIHTHPFKKMAIAWLNNKLANHKIPIIATEWTEPKTESAHWFDKDTKYHIHKVSAFIATNNAVKEGIENFHGYKGEISLIPHLINDPELNSNVSAGSNSVGCIARLSAEKGLDYLIAAWKFVIDVIPDANLHIYGHGIDEEHLKYLTECFGLKESIHFKGTFEPDGAIDSIISKYQLFVQPSLFESIPTSLIQIALAGKPIVATNVGGVPEILNIDKDSLVTPGDSRQLSKAIISKLKNIQTSREIAKSIKQDLQKQYNLDSNIDKIYSLYNKHS